MMYPVKLEDIANQIVGERGGETGSLSKRGCSGRDVSV